MNGDFGHPDNVNFGTLDKVLDLRTTDIDSVIPIDTLVKAGVRVAMGSDWDLNAKNPWQAIQNATTRGQQSVDLKVFFVDM